MLASGQIDVKEVHKSLTKYSIGFCYFMEVVEK